MTLWPHHPLRDVFWDPCIKRTRLCIEISTVKHILCKDILYSRNIMSSSMVCGHSPCVLMIFLRHLYTGGGLV